MPAYKSARHGVSLSQALHEAANVAPVTRAIVSTFELYHPLGTPSGAIYVVNDPSNLVATKEATATRDAGLTVTFLACQVSLTRPEESDGANAPQLSVSAANVSGLMSDALKAARGSIVPWELIERPYATDDLSGPAILPPLTLYLDSADVNADVISLTASFGDSANVGVPRIHFKRSEYPGLVI
jgi:hypothetical protein